MTNPRRGQANNFWLVVLISVVLIGGLGVLMWAPWKNQGLEGGTLHLYCAAGLREPVEEIVRRFHEEYREKYNVNVQISYGGSGELLAKMRIQKGRENDLFISADAYHMLEAQKQKLIAESMTFAFLQPVLVVSSKTQRILKDKGKPVTGLRDLLRDDLQIIVGLPEQTAVGRFTKKLLSRKDIDLWSKLKSATHAGTVNEVVQKVYLNANAVGIAWKPNALQYTKQGNPIDVIEVPEFKDDKKETFIGVAARLSGSKATAALQFARYLSARDKGLKIFAKYNYEVVPDGDDWAVFPNVYLSAGAMLQPGIEKVVEAFQKREGCTIHTDYAGCGILVSKMKALKSGATAKGEFPDAYFACDIEFMEAVQPWFQKHVDVSKNPMVMIVAKGNPKKITKLHDLLRKDFEVIGLGHPTHSALGKLTKDLLEKIGLQKLYDEDAKERTSFESAGHDLVAKVRTGALDVAIVYVSNAKANPENKRYLDIIPIDVPEALANYVLADQPFAVAKESRHGCLMKRFLRAVVAAQTADRFRALGFKWVYKQE